LGLSHNPNFVYRCIIILFEQQAFLKLKQIFFQNWLTFSMFYNICEEIYSSPWAFWGPEVLGEERMD
jgi:hypothetical protein